MRKEILSALTMLVMTLALCVTVSAQSNTQQQTAAIPFQFNIGKQVLPAGEYTVSYVNRDSGKSALLFRSADGRTSRIVMMNHAQKSAPQEKAVLVFNRYGNRYFLSEVWTSGDQFGLSLPSSRTERELARANGESDNAPAARQRVTVALNTRR